MLLGQSVGLVGGLVGLFAAVVDHPAVGDVDARSTAHAGTSSAR